MICYNCSGQGEIIDKIYVVCNNCKLILYEKPKPKKCKNKLTHLNNLLRKLQFGNKKQSKFVTEFRLKNKDFRLSYHELEKINTLFTEYVKFVGLNKHIFYEEILPVIFHYLDIKFEYDFKPEIFDDFVVHLEKIIEKPRESSPLAFSNSQIKVSKFCIFPF